VIVVDASFLASALIADDDVGERMRLRLDVEDLVCAPEVIDLEVASAWRRDLLAGHIGEDRSRLALDDLANLSLARMPHRPLMHRIWELRHNLTPYDAAYVALAESLDTMLLTADGRLARAPTPQCEIELIEGLDSESRQSRRGARRVLSDGCELDDDPARIDIDIVHRYLSEDSYWAQGRTRERQAELNRAAARVVGCYREGRQLGYARAISDGVSLAYLADLFVLPEARGRGLGGEIVRELVERGPLASLRWLLHTEDAHGLYEGFGFEPPVRSVLERPANIRA
jgi:predicted nucleic acid-binding protein/GNAT superfamily N-acetyltransferase